ncbi:MAG: R3H domain-containing nucleic acid-binding protein [Dehalococcoidales bacterium]|nr:R3H domain-containing nucleic acid-binding protein [Dehalococcoidales bacterium]
MQKVITDDLDALLDILPDYVRQSLSRQEDISDLLEVILDLGRLPEARFPRRETVLDSKEVEEHDIDFVVERISNFGDDNRAGITRTLHRISAIRNRKGRVVGLTLRVGRAVFGTIQIIQDLIQSGKSVLLLGRPGVGKTTMLREVARVLADDLKKRVIVVDTSNEIAGDGDIPHPAIGHARRMQVPTPNLQHAVMIEAVENHMPEVIVIDEIGTELEALAARTIAERGVQLVGTAHGNTLENLMMNPTLVDLVGGIQSVTLGDEEARRRGTQKSILERKSPPTFDIVVEIQDRDRVAIHPDVGEAVDALLRREPTAPEVRSTGEDGQVRIEKGQPGELAIEKAARPQMSTGEMPRIYLFGVNRGRIEQMAHESHVSLDIVDNFNDANLLVTSKQYYRRKPQKVREAEATNMPIYVLKSSTPNQIRQLIHNIYPLENTRDEDYTRLAVGEAEKAVEQVKGGQEEAVELSPQSAYIRRLQHLVAERSGVASHSYGKEPHRHVRIYK